MSLGFCILAPTPSSRRPRLRGAGDPMWPVCIPCGGERSTGANRSESDRSADVEREPVSSPRRRTRLDDESHVCDKNAARRSHRTAVRGRDQPCRTCRRHERRRERSQQHSWRNAAKAECESADRYLVRARLLRPEDRLRTDDESRDRGRGIEDAAVRDACARQLQGPPPDRARDRSRALCNGAPGISPGAPRAR